MFERYTEAARRAIFSARFECVGSRSELVDTRHLLLGLLHERNGLLQTLLPPGTGLEELRAEMMGPAPPGGISSSRDIPLSPDAKQVLAWAHEQAENLQSRHIDCVHLLLAMLSDGGTDAARVLAKYGIDRERVLGATS